MTDTAPFLDMLTRGRQIRRLRDLEARLFEIVGSWVQDEPDTAAKLLFGPVSFHHADHAETLAGLLPTPADQYPAAYTGDCDLSILQPVELATTTAERLDALGHRVLPAVRLAYLDALSTARRQTDQPMIRLLERIFSELGHDLDKVVHLRE
jgi:hypothetical protein